MGTMTCSGKFGNTVGIGVVIAVRITGKYTNPWAAAHGPGPAVALQRNLSGD